MIVIFCLFVVLFIGTFELQSVLEDMWSVSLLLMHRQKGWVPDQIRIYAFSDKKPRWPCGMLDAVATVGVFNLVPTSLLEKKSMQILFDQHILQLGNSSTEHCSPNFPPFVQEQFWFQKFSPKLLVCDLQPWVVDSVHINVPSYALHWFATIYINKHAHMIFTIVS